MLQVNFDLAWVNNLQPRSKKLGTFTIFWACTLQSPCPCALFFKSAVWESLSDFQLCEEAGGGNG